MASRQGANSGAQVTGLADFRRELKALDDSFPRELRNVHKTIADMSRDGARGVAVGMGGVFAHNAAAIRSYASVGEARVGIREGSRYPSAPVAFWGAKKRTGWYAAKRYRDSTGQQFRSWVGDSWDAATFNGGPYAINRALYFDLPEIIEQYAQMIDRLAAKAFPN